MDFQNYSSKKNRIEFQYPAGWTCEEYMSNDETSPTYIATKSLDATSGILVIYSANLMSTFGTSLFPHALYESYNSSTSYGNDNKIEVIETPHPVTIDGVQTAGTFIIRHKNESPAFITQTWIVYLEIVANEEFRIGEYGYKIIFRSEDFHDPRNIEIRKQLLKYMKFYKAQI